MPIDAAPAVRPRLLTILLLPLLGLLAVAGVAAYLYVGPSGRLDDPRALVSVGVAADRTATELTKERYTALTLLLTGSEPARSAYTAQIRATDAQFAQPPAGLADLRQRVAAAPQEVAAGDYLMQYTQMISDVVELRQDLPRRPAPAAVNGLLRASGWLAVAREQLAQIQLLERRGADTPAWHESLAAHQAAHLDALRRFGETAPAPWRERLAHVPNGLGGDPQPALDALSGLAAYAGDDSAAAAGTARSEQQRTLIAGLAAVLAIAAASILLAVRAARVPRRKVAEPIDPEEFQVVRLEAARAVAEQTALRVGTSAAVIGLARRSQRLADELVHHLDAAERDEADPDRLSQLFALDHLATRIRHDNQSLLVLAGADTVIGRRDPVTLLDLLRAAQSRIKDYPRIEYSMVAPDVHLAPDAVDDVVHLLAELFDNATRYGPPDRPVLVEGRREGTTAVVEVADRGAGLDPQRLAELNARLADPPPLDASEAHHTGLAVAARLAARHGLTVTLRPPPSGTGLRAIVRIPADLVLDSPSPATDPPVARRLPPRPFERGGALPGGEPVDVPHPRSTLVPVVPGPIQTSDGPTVVLEPESVRDLMTGYQHTSGFQQALREGRKSA
ncbi:sensor histidine kinase [Dactylosporangium vinaceum]|uniref:histidine kinase n=1 Tax=Dactylosporangium vinaceum TaxID=53362 RepID=A0ABV5MNB1_9ACTN|nr:ATP-binding protein [Dactylosporangium vinaceum]UAB98579.1 sensor histidine kinase [Dactylosporangium vinaceum]